VNELIFPISAVLMVFLVIIPGLTLISRWYLARKRAKIKSWANFGSESTFAWIVAPTLLPITWFISSAFHQTESTQSQASCLIDHAQVTTCDDALFLVGFLLIGMVLSVALRTWREKPNINLHYVGEDSPYFERVSRILENAKPDYKMKIKIVQDSPEPMFTIGWFRPSIVLDACFLQSADDEMILAALLHESAHITGFDTFRGFIGRLCLSINPVGFLLQNDFQHWQSAREVQCDSVAVSKGGQALALAESIVSAARLSRLGVFAAHECRLPGAAHLCGPDAAILKLRLAILFDGPAKPLRTFGQIILGLGLATLLLLPHLQSIGLLEHFHFEVEAFFHTYL